MGRAYFSASMFLVTNRSVDIE